MKVLAVDTATDSCSVAAIEGETLRAEMTVVSRQTHSRHLMEMIQAVLGSVGWRLDDLEGYVAARGPGSFTGLRIGISTLKGLCAATGKPLAGVSNLEALARQAPVRTGDVCAWIDARRREVYCCRYRYEGGRLKKMMPEDVMAPAAALEAAGSACMFIGDGALLYRQLIREILGPAVLFAPQECHPLRAATLAFMGRARLVKGESDDPVRFIPHYIRKSDARLPGGHAREKERLMAT